MKGIRPEIVHFAQLMENRMSANATTKAGWKNVSVSYAYERLMQEIGELAKALIEGDDHGAALWEVADCGNFLMMLMLALKQDAKSKGKPI